MPHAWWHRPEIWSDYAAPALGAAVQAPVIKQTLEGIEALHRRGVVPTVSRALEPLPLRWEETPGVPQDAPWYRPDEKFQQGRVVSNFDQYLTPEGDISPGGVLRQLGSVTPAGWAQAIAEENLPITPVRPDTLQQQNIMDEARARGIGPFGQDPFADFTPSGREQREIREDLYKLPPYTRGIAEELPYLAVPPARVMRGGLQAARTGPALSSFNIATGAARPLAAPARGAIRATEMALKPLEVVEEGLARAVAAPFRGAAAGYRALQPTPTTQVPQIPRGPSAQQAISGPSVEPTPEPGASMYDYQRQVGGSADPDVQPTPAQAVPEQVVSRETLSSKERVQLLSESTNPVVKELLKIHTEGVTGPSFYGTVSGRPIEISNLGLDLSRRESNELDKILVSLQGTRSQTTGELTDNVISRVPMRIRDRTVRGGFRNESGIQIARNREGRTPEQLNRFLAALEEIDVTPSRGDALPQELPVNRVNRPDLPEQYFDDAGELLTEDIVIGNYINPIKEIVQVDKPRGGWSSVIRKLERQIERTEDADIVEDLDDVRGMIDGFRDMERDGMPAEDWSLAKDDAFSEIIRSIEDLRPSDQFADTLEEAVEINRLLTETPEPSVAAAVPEPTDIVPEPVGTRFEPTELTAEPIEVPDRFDLSPQEQLDLERSRTPDIPLQEMSVQSYRERFPDVINSSIEAVSNAVLREPFKRALRKAVGAGNLSGRGTASVYRKLVSDRFPEFRGADWIMNWRDKWWGKGAAFENRVDNAARGANPGAALDISNTTIGPSEAQIIHRSINSATDRAANRIDNLINAHLKPAIAKGVVLDDVERYVQGKHWIDINRKFQKRVIPQVWDADTQDFIPVSGSDLDDWTNRGWLQRNKNYTAEQLDELESAATAVKNLYAEQRTRLFEEGILTPEVYRQWQRDYSWYNPIDYVEYLDSGMAAERLGGRFNVVDDGVYALSQNLNIKMGATSIFGETLWRHVAREEMRMAQNKGTRVAVEVLLRDGAVKEVTEKFVTVRKDGTKELKKLPYSEEEASGYFSYFENGERRVFGAPDGKEVYKNIWDDVMGRTGMAMDSDSIINIKLAATNGWFRSVYTTYNPLFWVRNMVIDMFTVGLKAGVDPITVGGGVIRGLYAVTRNKEQRFAEMMRLMGGWDETSGYIQGRLIQDIRREVAKAGQTEGAIVATSSKQIDKLLRNNILDRAKDTAVRIGGAIEAAPRYAAAEKTLKKTIGKDELNRLKNLSDEEFTKEMLDGWNPKYRIDDITGKQVTIPDADRRTLGGFVDTPQAQTAAENSFEATLDFSRGGAQIKKLNDYFLFLNAAAEGAKLPFRALGIDLFPVIKPVQNPTRNGPQYEFGSASEQLKRYATLGMGDRGVSRRTMDVISGGPAGTALRLGSVITAYLAIQEYWNKSFTYQGTPLYYDIPQYVRYNSLVFMLPPERDDNGELVLDPATDRPKPKYILVPHRLREWNSIFQAATFLSEETDEDEAVANDKRRWATEVFKSTSPIAELPMPEIFNLAAEQLTGYDLWRESPIVPEDLQEGPLEEQYTSRTSKSIRAAAGVVDELDVVPDPLQDLIGSPSRLEHLYESILGGVGTTSLTMADFAGELMEEMRGVEARPMEEKVADYRDMNRLERAEFRASLSESEYRQFEKEIREPKKEVPFWSALERSFYPQRGGGLREAGRRAALSENPEISEKDTRSAGVAASKVRRELLTEQQGNDSFLDNWRNKDKTKGALSPKDWREAKSDKWKKYEGAQIAISRIYKNAAQSADPNVKDKYYSDIYTAAGTMPDTRVGVDFLLAGYYAIEPTEDSPTDVNWDEFFSERNEYVASIQSKSEAGGDGLFELFQRSLEANDTPTEKAYDSARELLAPYWNVGKNLSEITSGATPEIQQLWDEYLTADRGTQRQMQDNIRFIDTLIELRSLKRKSILEQDAARGGVMDEILVFWYGDFHQGVTLRGQQYHDQLYGKTSTGFVPRPTEAIPVRTR